MKKLVFCLISSILLTSCKYGFNELFGRNDEVNERSHSLVNLNDGNLAPNLNDSDSYSVLFVTDTHFGRVSSSNGARQDEDFFKKLSEIKNEYESAGTPLRFAVCCGDLVETGLKENYEKFSAELQNKLLNDFNLNLYSVVGNHDLYASGFDNWKNTVYQKSSAYKFVTGNNQKISWYFLDTGNGTLGSKQFEHFRTLSMGDPNPKIVISHYPIYGDGIVYFSLQNRNERDKIISLLSRTNTMCYIAGHAHSSKVDYSYGEYFTEHVIQGYLDQREFVILTVNNGDYSIKRYKY